MNLNFLSSNIYSQTNIFSYKKKIATSVFQQIFPLIDLIDL